MQKESMSLSELGQLKKVRLLVAGALLGLKVSACSRKRDIFSQVKQALEDMGKAIGSVNETDPDSTTPKLSAYNRTLSQEIGITAEITAQSVMRKRSVGTS